MSSFNFKNVVFYIQVLVNLICVRNFGKMKFCVKKVILTEVFSSCFTYHIMNNMFLSMVIISI